MPPPRISQALLSQMSALSISLPAVRPSPLIRHAQRCIVPSLSSQCPRLFSSTPRSLDWLTPRRGETKKSRKGRPRVPTGGSMRGTTIVWGDYGLRLLDHHRRISAQQLKIAEETIKKRLRGTKFRLYKRIAANIGVYTSGNETRMGKGKGSFDHWASRVAVSKIVFELKGEVHEQIVKDAFRLAGNKLPGQWEFVRKGDPPVMGITKIAGDVTVESLMRPRKPLPLQITAGRLPSSTPDVPAAM